MLKALVQKEVRAVLEAQRHEIRQWIREALLPELHRLVQDELERALHLEGPEAPAPVGTAEVEAPLSQESVAAGEVATPDEAATPDPERSGEAKYLYGVVKKGGEAAFGPVGIEGEEVYTVWGDEVGAVVHDCPAQPYESSDEATVKRWLMAHQNVVDMAWKHHGAVIPTSFDTLIAAEAGCTADETVKRWLSDGQGDFLTRLKAFADKAEYGVQVFWDAPVMMQTLAQENEALQKMTAELQEKPKGSAYLHRQKLETVLKKELETKADLCFREFYEDIKRCVTEVKIEKTKKAEDPARQMIMNLTCLLPQEESGALGQELERINQMACFFVRFTGPWPPYSFA